MQSSTDLDGLITAYMQLDVVSEPQRAMDLLRQASALVDRSAEPQKWAGLRSLFADLAEHDDPAAAVDGYRDALQVWDPVEQRDPWLHCQLQLGCLLALSPPGSTDAELAIGHLEHVVGEYPNLSQLLGNLYGWRPQGDPSHNWRKRIHYLERAQELADSSEDVAVWAAVSNDLACAFPEEPAGDYAAAMEKRIVLHRQVLEALRAADGSVVQTCLHLAKAYLDRVEGSLEDNGAAAESYLREALAMMPASGDEPQRIEALLLHARCLVFKRAEHDIQSLHEALKVLAQARALAEHRPQPELRASVEKLFALAYLEFLQLGQHQHLKEFVHCCATALKLFEGPTFGSERRKVLQIQADGLMAVEDLATASECFTCALDLAENGLTQAHTTAGRMERIWELRDSASLLAYCHARAGRLAEAVTVLDRGKARLWRPATQQLEVKDLADAVPSKGAVVLPILSGPKGLVILMTATDGNPTFTLVELPAFGKKRVLELQRGADPTALGGWLQAYCYRRSEPAAFQDQILRLGEALYREFWTPVLDRLPELGVSPGAVLVLLPQGASAGFPWQAAWKDTDGQRAWLADNYALRFAPSLASLRRDHRSEHPGGLAVVAANPNGDLPFGALETAWIQAVHPEAEILSDTNAKRDRVLAALHSCRDVHIATHADFNLDDPLQSRLRLNDGDLTLAQLVDHLKPRHPNFLVLSACETGVTRVTSLADEFLGFPAALLEAGIHTVLATQWSVDDASAALVMGQFYRERAALISTPAECLQRSQQWLRNLTVADLMTLLREMRGHPGPAGELASTVRSRLRGRDGHERPYAHPYYWAGFITAGTP